MFFEHTYCNEQRLFSFACCYRKSILNIVITISCKKKRYCRSCCRKRQFLWYRKYIITNIYYAKCIGLNVLKNVQQIFSRTFIGIIICNAVSSFTLLINCGELTHLLIGVVVYAAVYAASLFAYGANDDEKKLILNLFHRKQVKGN